MALYRFAEIELDSSQYELRRQGRILRLEKRPLDILILLVERNGDLVTREEILERIWGKDVFVDSEAGINTAIRKIRQTLHDDPENPSFVQTVVGRGYRFCAQIEPQADQPAIALPPTNFAKSRRPAIIWGGAFMLLMVVLVLFGVNARGSRDWLFGKSRLRPIHAIAVLPLDNLSGDPREDYFADGMTDELTTNLAKVHSLSVISRSSVMRFKRTNKSLSEIAQDLNVDVIVQGSVVHVGNNVRVTAQLIDPASGYHLWADDFDRPQQDVLLLQRDVATEIVQGIRATLTDSERIRLGGTKVVDPRAYEANLKGRSYWNQRTEAAIGKAIEQFKVAIQADPNYGAAYSGLADSYTALGYFSYLSPDDSFPKAKAAAERALDLDSTLAEAHASLGYYNLYYAWNWNESEKQFNEAIDLNPNYATARDWHSVYLTAAGRPDEAKTEILHAKQLDPLSPGINTDVGFQLYYSGHYDEAIQQLGATLKTDPRFPLAHLWLGRSYQQKGMYDAAIAEYRQTDEAWPGWVVSQAAIGNVEGLSGKKDEAQQVLTKLNTESRTRYVTPYGVALVYASLGEKDQAFHWLEKAVRDRSHWLVWLRLDPRWNPIRSDLRFKQLVHQIGFPNQEPSN